MSKKGKRVPLRKCVVCGEQRDKKDLIRIVNNKEEGVLVDESYKKNGRGAYLCKNKTCVEKAVETGRLKSALKTDINAKIYDQIKEIVMNS